MITFTDLQRWQINNLINWCLDIKYYDYKHFSNKEQIEKLSTKALKSLQKLFESSQEPQDKYNIKLTKFNKEILCEILDFGIKMGYCDYYHYGFTYTVDKVEEITRRSLRKILTIVQ
ncbi:hypothetical protein [Filifactor alocis]|uniref:hypothetical protein n=1 Tax=Filifactor alocis TaxID=143361 RepID=UPI003FA11EB5